MTSKYHPGPNSETPREAGKLRFPTPADIQPDDMRKAIVFSALGPVLGLLLATWIGPKFLLWWFKPPVNPGFDCSPAIFWGMKRLIGIQIVGLAVGLIVGLLLAFALSRRQKTQA